MFLIPIKLRQILIFYPTLLITVKETVLDYLPAGSIRSMVMNQNSPACLTRESVSSDLWRFLLAIVAEMSTTESIEHNHIFVVIVALLIINLTN